MTSERAFGRGTTTLSGTGGARTRTRRVRHGLAPEALRRSAVEILEVRQLFAAPVVDSFTASPAEVTWDEDVVLTAAASDPDGTVAAVGFYVERNGTPGLQQGAGGDELLEQDATAPFGTSVYADDLADGTNTYYAVATDDLGATSAAVSTTSVVLPDRPPVVHTFTATPNPIAAGGTLSLVATATDPDEVLVVVEFYRESNGVAGLQPDDLFLDFDFRSPFGTTVDTAGLSPGTYTYYATATDGRLRSVTTATVTNTITAPPAGAPTATLSSAPDITAPGGSAYYFTVTYTDDVAIDYRSILAGNDILVTGPGNFSQLAVPVNLPTPADLRVWTPTYMVTAPGGTWDVADAGPYSVSLRPNEVSDTAGNFAPAGTLGAFDVALTDSAPPAATLTHAPVVSSPGGSVYYFTVTYSDETEVDYQTILAGNDVVVTGPGGYSALATPVNLPTPPDLRVWTATYIVNAPGGAWDNADAGTYTITLRANEVADTGGNLSPQKTLGTFLVSMPPVAQLTFAPDVTTPGGGAYYFTVTYTGGVDIDYRTLLAGNDILVTGPNGFSQPATIVNLPTPPDHRVWTATYMVAAPGGAWDPVDSGPYSVFVQPNEVADVAGNFSPGKSIGAFAVELEDPKPPTAELTFAPDVTSPGATGYYFVVTYRDDAAIDYRSILAGNDVQVTGPGNYSQLATLVNLPTPADHRVWTATYLITPPGGTWDAADSGPYDVLMRPGEVTDLAGNSVAAGSLGDFTVTIPPPAPAALRVAESPTLSVFSDTVIDSSRSVLDDAAPAPAV